VCGVDAEIPDGGFYRKLTSLSSLSLLPAAAAVGGGRPLPGQHPLLYKPFNQTLWIVGGLDQGRYGSCGLSADSFLASPQVDCAAAPDMPGCEGRWRQLNDSSSHSAHWVAASNLSVMPSCEPLLSKCSVVSFASNNTTHA
jgi:hypothetical protein